MTFRKGALADVMWLMVLMVCGVILMFMMMSFSSVPTIDSYVENILDEEISVFTNSISGYSANSSYCMMFNSKGVKRDFGSVSSSSASSPTSNSATSNQVVNYSKNVLKENVMNAFASNKTLVANTTLSKDDIVINFKENARSTMVTVVIKYKVNILGFGGRSGGFVEQKSFSIPRKAVATRTVENIYRFRS